MSWGRTRSSTATWRPRAGGWWAGGRFSAGSPPRSPAPPATGWRWRRRTTTPTCLTRTWTTGGWPCSRTAAGSSSQAGGFCGSSGPRRAATRRSSTWTPASRRPPWRPCTGSTSSAGYPPCSRFCSPCSSRAGGWAGWPTSTGPGWRRRRCVCCCLPQWRGWHTSTSTPRGMWAGSSGGWSGASPWTTAHGAGGMSTGRCAGGWRGPWPCAGSWLRRSGWRPGPGSCPFSPRSPTCCRGSWACRGSGPWRRAASPAASPSWRTAGTCTRRCPPRETRRGFGRMCTCWGRRGGLWAWPRPWWGRPSSGIRGEASAP